MIAEKTQVCNVIGCYEVWTF